jgi:hypothetical protein
MTVKRKIRRVPIPTSEWPAPKMIRLEGWKGSLHVTSLLGTNLLGTNLLGTNLPGTNLLGTNLLQGVAAVAVAAVAVPGGSSPPELRQRLVERKRNDSARRAISGQA